MKIYKLTREGTGGPTLPHVGLVPGEAYVPVATNDFGTLYGPLVFLASRAQKTWPYLLHVE